MGPVAGPSAITGPESVISKGLLCPAMVMVPVIFSFSNWAVRESGPWLTERRRRVRSALETSAVSLTSPWGSFRVSVTTQALSFSSTEMADSKLWLWPWASSRKL
ncbi:hypothetical protein HRbin09_02024 [bacterium HR09]|nr:hypothetical protein HRbin09_02024 [bacterium HR09]